MASSRHRAPGRRHHRNSRGQSTIASVILGAVALVVGSGAVGIAVNHFSPRRIALLPRAETAGPAPSLSLPEGVKAISLADARSAFEQQSAVFVDARPASDYSEAHVPGAVNLPAPEFDEAFPSVADRVEAASAIIVYCEGAECSDSIQVAERLAEYGFPNIGVLESGWRSWKGSGGPAERGPQP